MSGKDVYDNHTSFEDSVTSFALHSLGQLPTPLNVRFFSTANLDRIQRELAESTAPELGGLRISRQSDNALQIIMLRMYRDNLREIDSIQGVEDQLRAMNGLVVERCARMVVDNALNYLRYMRDISAYPEPMARPEHVSIAGMKSIDNRTLI